MSGPEDQGNYIMCSGDRSWSVLGEDRSVSGLSPNKAETSHFPLRAPRCPLPRSLEALAAVGARPTQGDGWNDKHTMSSCVVLTVTLEVYKQELQFPFPK